MEVLESWFDNNTIRYIRPSQTYEGTIAGYVNKLYIDDKYIYPNNTLYVSTDGQGSHTYSYVSSFEFVPNSNVSVLIPKQKMSLSEKLYYAMCISANRCNSSYGRKPKGDRLKSILITWGLIPRPLGRKTGGRGDLFPSIHKDFKEKSSI